MTHEQLSRNGTPLVGFGEAISTAVAVSTSPWTVALATSVVGAATGWVIEELAKNVRRKRK